MKVKPFKEQVIELLLRYLQHQMGQKQIANKLRQKHIKNLPQWILTNNLLINKGLTKIVKSFVQMDKKIKQYFVQRKSQSSEQDQSQKQIEEEVPKKSQQKPKKQRKISTASIQSTQKLKINKKDKKKQQKQQKSQKKVLLTNGNQNNYHDNTSVWVKNKFEPPKKLQQIGKDYQNQNKLNNVKKPSMIPKEASSQQSSDRPMHSDHSSSSQQKDKIKKKKSQKLVPVPNKNTKSSKNNKKKQSSSQQSQQVSQQQVKKPVLNGKKLAKQEKKQDKSAKITQKDVKPSKNQQKHLQKTHVMHTRLDDKTPNDNVKQSQDNKNTNKIPQMTFSRIKVDQIGPIPEKLRDNSFEAKFKYGKGGDQWGRYGHEKLKDTRGQSFKKTKDKLKNKAFQGANIDFNAINSIRLD